MAARRPGAGRRAKKGRSFSICRLSARIMMGQCSGRGAGAAARGDGDGAGEPGRDGEKRAFFRSVGCPVIMTGRCRGPGRGAAPPTTPIEISSPRLRGEGFAAKAAKRARRARVRGWGQPRALPGPSPARPHRIHTKPARNSPPPLWGRTQLGRRPSEEGGAGPQGSRSKPARRPSAAGANPSNPPDPAPAAERT